jgi:hypothetical protein
LTRKLIYNISDATKSCKEFQDVLDEGLSQGPHEEDKSMAFPPGICLNRRILADGLPGSIARTSNGEVRTARNKYAEAHQLPSRTARLDWQDTSTALSTQCVSDEEN